MSVQSESNMFDLLPACEFSGMVVTAHSYSDTPPPLSLKYKLLLAWCVVNVNAIIPSTFSA